MSTIDHIEATIRARRDRAKDFRDQAASQASLKLAREWQLRAEAYGTALKLIREIREEDAR